MDSIKLLNTGDEVGLKFRPKTFSTYTSGTIKNVNKKKITILMAGGCSHTFALKEVEEITVLS